MAIFITHNTHKEKTMYEFHGEVTKVYETKTVGTKGRQRREFRVKELPEGKYSNIVPFTLKGDRCKAADSLSVGDEVKIGFVLEGNEWAKPGSTDEPRCFCNNVCLKLEVVATRGGAEDSAPEPDAEPDGDMPF